MSVEIVLIEIGHFKLFSHISSFSPQKLYKVEKL